MNTKKLGSALISLMAMGIAVPAAHAADDFDGAYVGLSTGVVQNQVDFTWSGRYSDNSAWADVVEGMSRHGGAGRLSAGYGFHTSGRIHLGVSGFADFGQREMGQYGYGESGPPVYVYSMEAKLKDLRGLALEPGWALSESTMAYLRLGVTYGKVEFASSYLDDGETGLETVTKNVRGTALGWGIKHMVSPRLFVGVEVNYTRFGTETVLLDNGAEQVDFKPRQTQGLVTLGYRF